MPHRPDLLDHLLPPRLHSNEIAVWVLGPAAVATASGGRSVGMKQRPRIYYTEAQKALMWDRWKAGDTWHEIGKLFD